MMGANSNAFIGIPNYFPVNYNAVKHNPIIFDPSLFNNNYYSENNKYKNSFQNNCLMMMRPYSLNLGKPSKLCSRDEKFIYMNCTPELPPDKLLFQPFIGDKINFVHSNNKTNQYNSKQPHIIPNFNSDCKVNDDYNIDNNRNNFCRNSNDKNLSTKYFPKNDVTKEEETSDMCISDSGSSKKNPYIIKKKKKDSHCKSRWDTGPDDIRSYSPYSTYNTENKKENKVNNNGKDKNLRWDSRQMIDGVDNRRYQNKKNICQNSDDFVKSNEYLKNDGRTPSNYLRKDSNFVEGTQSTKNFPNSCDTDEVQFNEINNFDRKLSEIKFDRHRDNYSKKGLKGKQFSSLRNHDAISDKKHNSEGNSGSHFKNSYVNCRRLFNSNEKGGQKNDVFNHFNENERMSKTKVENTDTSEINFTPPDDMKIFEDNILDCNFYPNKNSSNDFKLGNSESTYRKINDNDDFKNGDCNSRVKNKDVKDISNLITYDDRSTESENRNRKSRYDKNNLIKCNDEKVHIDKKYDQNETNNTYSGYYVPSSVNESLKGNPKTKIILSNDVSTYAVERSSSVCDNTNSTKYIEVESSENLVRNSEIDDTSHRKSSLNITNEGLNSCSTESYDVMQDNNLGQYKVKDKTNKKCHTEVISPMNDKKTGTDHQFAPLSVKSSRSYDGNKTSASFQNRVSGYENNNDINSANLMQHFSPLPDCPSSSLTPSPLNFQNSHYSPLSCNSGTFISNPSQKVSFYKNNSYKCDYTSNLSENDINHSVGQSKLSKNKQQYSDSLPIAHDGPESLKNDGSESVVKSDDRRTLKGLIDQNKNTGNSDSCISLSKGEEREKNAKASQKISIWESIEKLRVQNRCLNCEVFRSKTRESQICEKCSKLCPRKNCRHCLAEFFQHKYCTLAEKIYNRTMCLECAQNMAKYNTEPAKCLHCDCWSAWASFMECDRCLMRIKKYGNPICCDMCQKYCAFDRGPEARDKLGGKNLCFLCAYRHKKDEYFRNRGISEKNKLDNPHDKNGGRGRSSDKFDDTNVNMHDVGDASTNITSPINVNNSITYWKEIAERNIKLYEQANSQVEKFQNQIVHKDIEIQSILQKHRTELVEIYRITEHDKQELASLKSENKRLEDKFDSYFQIKESEFRSLGVKNQVYVSELHGCIDKLKSKNEQLSKENDRYLNEIRELRKEKNSLRKESKLEKELERLMRDNRVLINQLKAFHSHNESESKGEYKFSDTNSVTMMTKTADNDPDTDKFKMSEEDFTTIDQIICEKYDKSVEDSSTCSLGIKSYSKLGLNSGDVTISPSESEFRSNIGIDLSRANEKSIRNVKFSKQDEDGADEEEKRGIGLKRDSSRLNGYKKIISIEKYPKDINHITGRPNNLSNVGMSLDHDIKFPKKPKKFASFKSACLTKNYNLISSPEGKGCENVNEEKKNGTSNLEGIGYLMNGVSLINKTQSEFNEKKTDTLSRCENSEIMSTKRTKRMNDKVNANYIESPNSLNEKSKNDNLDIEGLSAENLSQSARNKTRKNKSSGHISTSPRRKYRKKDIKLCIDNFTSWDEELEEVTII